LDASLDLISCSLTLEHIEDLGNIFAQASKKLKAKGIFYICELHPFKQYLGTKARFEKAGETIELEVFIHHISEFVEVAKRYGFKLESLKEWFDENENGKLPRLVSFVFVAA